MNRAVSNRRLLRLAEYLEEVVPPEKFSIDCWTNETEKPCQSAGCAVGWATTIPAFRRAGLKLSFEPTDLHGGGYATPVLDVGARRYHSWTAVMKFFGVTEDQALDLFNLTAYKARGQTEPQEVAERLRHFVETRD